MDSIYASPSNRAQLWSQKLTDIIDAKRQPVAVVVNRPDRFYWTNQTFPESETQNDNFDKSFLTQIDLPEDIRKSCTATSYHELTKNLTNCLFSFSGENCYRLQLQLRIPSLLHPPYFPLLTHVDLTATPRRPVTVYVNIEFSQLSPDELVFFPLNKAKTQYIAYPKSYVKSVEESICHDKEDKYYTYHVNGWYKSVVTNVQPSTIQHKFEQLHLRDSSHETMPTYKHQTSRRKSSVKKLSLRMRSTRRHAKPVMKQRLKNTKKDHTVHKQPKYRIQPSLFTAVNEETQSEFKSTEETACQDQENIDVAHTVNDCLKNTVTNTQPSTTSKKREKSQTMHRLPECEFRPVSTKAGDAKYRNRAVVREETQSGSHHSLKFAKELSAFNVLRKHAQQHPLQVLCLPTKDVSSDQFVATAGRVSHRDCSNQHENDQQYVSVRHRVRQRYAESRQPGTSAHHTSVDRLTSTTRDADNSIVEINFTRLPFDSKEITQLLHASDYSKIVQQVGTAPHTFQADVLIPSLFIVGVAYFKMSRHQEAQKHFKECEAAAKETNRDGDVMLCNAYLGDIEYSSQKYMQAAQYYKTAIAHHATGSVAVMFKLTPPTLSAVHAKLASSYRNASMMVQAIQHYKTAIDVARADRDCLSAHTSLGNLYQSVGDNSSALEEYKKSIELAEKLSDHVSLGWAHGNIGNAYLGLNKKDEAVYHLQKSLDLAVDYETTPQAIGRTYNNLGTAYQSMNDLDKAEEYYDLALSQAIYGNDIPGQARVYGNIGNVHMLRKNYERAIPHYSEVLHLSTDPPTISTARHNRGCAYYEWATFLQPKKQKWSASQREFQCTFHSRDCDIDVCLSGLPSRAKELYRKGCEDLKKVVDFHEERLQHIKGSPKGLTLSVSLFESNSRTFHRLQDCLVNLHRYEEALVVAEQSRARTLGELLLKRKEGQVMKSLTSPLSLDEIFSILKTLECPVLYFSYTGARLICWLFLPHPSDVSMNAFEIPLADDQFNGKSFDYLLRYSLTENLVERSFEMYQAIKYDTESSSEVQALYRLVGEPTLKILQKHINSSKTQKVMTISDSYTSLLPLTCLFDSQLNSFLGDHYSFNQIPSLLTMGVINQFPGIKVDLREDSRDFCILGDPNIPPFFHNGELWNLGRLPHARKEAEWVAHALQTTPVLGDQATKSSLLIRLMNAKVVHIATHGSASAGFLAFSSFAVHAHERLAGRNQVHGSNVLLYPEEVEKLTFSPALVVLSSCDSGRGVVKADGIQGMARAFILAGAQSVLTTLWKIPDESASVFMQFFYQYLLDEMKSTLALQKAILSVRCFAKYSQYIHWSGYQLTGRDIQFLSKPSLSSTILKQRLGEPSVFPRLGSIKKLENALVNNPCLPTDVQIVKGCPGVDPAEVVVDFISSNYKRFSGGIFWLNCAVSELMSSCLKYQEKVVGNNLGSCTVSETQQALVIFDSMTKLPESADLLRFLKNDYIHIIVISKGYESPNKLMKEVDRRLVRGCTINNIEPLTRIHSTQRMVHTLLKQLDVTPSNSDQEMFEKLAEFTTGSPVVVEIASQVVASCYDCLQQDAVSHLNEMLLEHNDSSRPSLATTEYVDVYKTSSLYDSWDSIVKLLDECHLSAEERLLLNCVSIFGSTPVPFALVTNMSSMITRINHKAHIAGSLHKILLKYKLLKQYPLPVVLHPAILKSGKSSQTLELVHVPQQISRCLWNSMEDVDKVAVFSVTFSSVSMLHQQSVDSDVSGVCSLLHELFEENYGLVGEQCYQQMYSLYISCK